MRPMIRLVILLLLTLALSWSFHRAGGPARATAQKEEPETFVPSEELPAGSAVSFPVDI